jgi:3-(3-hydroxy-phenyl)propionate hydroxylase/6-hydroxy-3-succinoylpyridine 3-monooxygenase
VTGTGRVLVVGGGPVGVLTALGLARAGVPVTVLEHASAVVPAPRAMVYHWSVLDGLERLGLYDAAVARGFLKQDYTYRVHRTGEQIRFGLQVLDGLVRHPYNLHLGQHALVEAALEALADLPHAEVRWDAALVDLEQDPTGVTAVVATPDGEQALRADWLVGADGARSAVRKALGTPFEGFTWPERFVATNARYPFDEQGYAQTTFLVDDVYGAIIAKIDNSGGTGLWRYTYCEPESLPVEGVLERMPRFLAAVLPDPDAFVLVAHSPYRMHQRAAPSFRDGRVLLAGDAAHVTNPTGGLGLTGGLFDSYVLSEALAAVVRREADPSVLDLYAAERRRVFVEVVSPAATENKRLIFSSSDPVRLEQDLARLRLLGTDRDAAVARLLFPKSLETPSLVGAR